MPSKTCLQALDDILENVLLAMTFVDNLTYAEFLEDKRTIYATIRALEIISEATRRLPNAVYDRHPHIPWQGIRGAGNIYRHDYEDVQERRVWETVIHAIPALKKVVQDEIKRL